MSVYARSSRIYRLNISTNWLTHSLTPGSRFFLQKLIVMQVLKFPTFYGTRRCITVSTRICLLFISWARYIHFMLPRSFHRIHPIPKACVILRNKLLFFCTEELLALRSTPKLEDRHLSSVHDCLCNIFAATFDINTTLYIYMLLGVVYVDAYELMV